MKRKTNHKTALNPRWTFFVVASSGPRDMPAVRATGDGAGGLRHIASCLSEADAVALCAALNEWATQDRKDQDRSRSWRMNAAHTDKTK